MTKSGSEMTPLERVSAAIAGKDFDVYPAISPTSIAIDESISAARTSFPTAHVDPTAMAALAAAGHELYRFDSVTPYFSVHLEAEALGAKIKWGRSVSPPASKSKIAAESYIVPDNFLSRTNFKNLLRAIRTLAKRYGGRVPVIGKVVGPWTLAYHLFGVENLILDTILEPERTKELIYALSNISVQFAKAQFDAGADLVTWADHVTNDIVSAQIYEEFVLPIHQKAAISLRSYPPIILHICGNVEDRLQCIKKTGFQMFHMDSRNNIASSLDVLGEKMCVTGCINNPRILSQGSLTQVRQQVKSNLRDGIKLISPECALPLNVPGDNLRELVKTAHQYHPGDVLRLKD